MKLVKSWLKCKDAETLDLMTAGKLTGSTYLPQSAGDTEESLCMKDTLTTLITFTIKLRQLNPIKHVLLN